MILANPRDPHRRAMALPYAVQSKVRTLKKAVVRLGGAAGRLP